MTATERSYLVVNENLNAGWRASIGGRPLRAVRLDGWKQAWLLPAGTAGTVTLTYRPDALYRDAIIGGLGTVALIVLVGGPWPSPRRRGRDARPAAAGRSRRGRPDPRFSSALTWSVVGSGLLLTGFWLGGYPGAVILPAATGLFMVAASYRRSGRYWVELSRPRVLTGLLLAASACAATGEHLLLAGNSGLLVTGLSSAVPQVICLLVVGRLAAALILPEP